MRLPLTPRQGLILCSPNDHCTNGTSSQRNEGYQAAYEVTADEHRAYLVDWQARFQCFKLIPQANRDEEVGIINFSRMILRRIDPI